MTPKYFKLLIFMLGILLAHPSQSQTFIHAASDLENDPTESLSPDVKSISYDFDVQLDSLWIKLDFYQRIDDKEWSVKIGLDTNFNENDGGLWPGMNQSMKYDILLDIYFNPNFPPPFTANVLDADGNYISSNLSTGLQDTSSFVLALSLSQTIPSVSILRVIAGCGLVFGSVNDDIPDASSFTINLGSAQLRTEKQKIPFKIYPNPATQDVFLSGFTENTECIEEYSIFSMDGQAIFHKACVNCRDVSIDVSDFSNGLYFIRISTGNNVFELPFIKNLPTSLPH